MPGRLAQIDLREKVGAEHVRRIQLHDQVETLQAIGHRYAGMAHITGGLFEAGESPQGTAVFAHRLDQSPESIRYAMVELEQTLRRVAGIAAEQFVATVARQHLGATVGLRDPGAVIGRQGGGVAEGLIVMLCDHWYAGHQVSRRHIVFMVFAAEVPGGEAGIRHFVVAFGVEADRVGGCRSAGHLAEHACHRRAIGATRQEGAYAFVAGKFFGDAVANQMAKGVARCGEGRSVLLFEMQRPVA
ncbi:MAG: hypothetical protein AW09_003393 [Candidatus Accumulibacter phosphatis]|uniref:Uncharacterized protein n=1 Tax=Candidatus Accumulibacter phosphatis TaxID=327160 RepID=A0A080LSP5_9PROT|nr:MAG: hypothetical protein AW09_003393 [Candidatus Accumulibacter phosphatis]